MVQEIMNMIYITTYLSVIYVKYSIGMISYNNLVKITCNEISQINIIFAKILQWDVFKSILTSNDDLQEFFTNFNSNVPYTTIDIDYETLDSIKNHAKNTNQVLIFENNSAPINSGTVALIYKASLNGNPIIIKMLRKNIHTNIKNGIHHIITLAKFYNFICSFFYQTTPSVLNTIKTNTSLLLEQTNLQQEIRNNELFQINIQRYSNIIVPRVYTEFSDINHNVIIMDFIEGVTLAHVKKKHDIAKFETMAENLRRFMIESYLIHKVVHADLHSGNIICKDDKIGLIDFGLVIKLSDKQSEYITDMLLSIRNNNYKRLTKSLGKLVSNGDNILFKQFIHLCDTSEKLKGLRNNFRSFNSKIVMEEALHLLNSVTIDPDNEAVKILLSLVSSFSVIDLCQIPNRTLGEFLFVF